jgi:hypothetical protein
MPTELLYDTRGTFVPHSEIARMKSWSAVLLLLNREAQPSAVAANS